MTCYVSCAIVFALWKIPVTCYVSRANAFALWSPSDLLRFMCCGFSVLYDFSHKLKQ